MKLYLKVPITKIQEVELNAMEVFKELRKQILFHQGLNDKAFYDEQENKIKYFTQWDVEEINNPDPKKVELLKALNLMRDCLMGINQ